MPNYSYTLYSDSKSREFNVQGVTGTVNISLTVRSTDSVVREGTQLQIVFNASESDSGSGGGLGADVFATVFGTQVFSERIKNSSISRTEYVTYNLSSMGRPSSATQYGYDHDIYVGYLAPDNAQDYCEYIPNIPPVVSISAPSQIYAGSTIQVRTVVSDYESDKMESGYSNMSYNSRVEAVYTVNGSTRTVVVNPALGLGTTDTSVIIPNDYVGGKVYFKAYARDFPSSQSTAETTSITILRNNPPSATFNITGVAPGNTATIAWVYTDPEGHNVLTSSLTRYYQAKNSTTWQTTALSVTSTSTSATDSIPLSYNGGTVYYLLKFADQYGAYGEQKSSTYLLQTVTPPTAPPSITYPSSVNGGESITVSWGKSTDVENNIAGYEVDRTYNGTTWTNVYKANQPNTVSTTTVVEYGQSYVIFRVRAFDTTGMYSDYTVGNTAEIINNQKPTTPTSITVPSSISTGQAIVIKWGASTDPDNDTITYVLERKVNRGAYEIATQTQSLNYTDTVGENWLYVQYRVKAVDTYGLSSSYKQSAERTVNQNHIPTITCQYLNNEDLGIKSELFTFTYSVNDADPSDTLTVKEYVDGKQIKTFTATRSTNYTFNFANGSKWETITNGDHSIQITVSDGKATKSLALTFTKAETGCTITLTDPIETTNDIYYVVLSVSYTLPYDNQWTNGSFNIALFNDKFHNIDAYCVGSSDTPSAGDWESCLIDPESSYTQNGNIFIQGDNVLIAMREGHVIFIHKFAAEGQQFNYRIIADTDDVDDLGHICSVQGTLGFSDITIPS